MAKIWIITHNAPPPNQDVRVRNKAMAKYLARIGHDVTIFGASTIHNTDINLIVGRELYIERSYDGLKFVHVKAPSYSGNGVTRIKNLMIYPFNLWRATKRFGSPDVIINDLEIFALNFPFKIAKRYKVPIISEVRDLMPESLIEYGYVKKNSLLAHVLYRLEKRIYIKSDRIVFSMDGGKEYLRDRGIDIEIPDEKVFLINNGVDLETYQYNKEHFQISDDDLLNDSIFKIIYTGSIRQVNNLGLLLDVAKLIKNPTVKFLVWGDGDELQMLKKRVEDEKIKNVLFKGRVSKEYIPFIVSKADMTIAHNNPSGLFKYGISFNKLFDYLAGGKPVLCDFPCKYNPVLRFEAGIEVAIPTANNIANAINQFITISPDRYNEYCKNAIVASKYYDYKNLSNMMAALVEDVLCNESNKKK